MLYPLIGICVRTARGFGRHGDRGSKRTCTRGGALVELVSGAIAALAWSIARIDRLIAVMHRCIAGEKNAELGRNFGSRERDAGAIKEHLQVPLHLRLRPGRLFSRVC